MIVSECLYVLCRKLENREINEGEHRSAILALVAFIAAIDPPPTGDRTLVRRAEEIRGVRSCRHSADGIYLALAEELATKTITEVVTFDNGMKSRATANSLVMQVKVLQATPPPKP